MTAKEDRGQDDIHTRAILRVGAALLITIALVATVAYVLWHNWAGPSAHDAPNGERNFAIARPVLESTPRTDRATYMAEKERLLHGYAWIDPKAGIARIPIEDAMRLLATQKKEKGQ